jgi:CheY-like chemotaxis protein
MDFAGYGPLVMVDDSSAELYIAKGCLVRSTLERDFVTLDSGQALLDYLEAARAHKARLPYLVLLDVNMPSMDGFTALERVRQTRGFEHLPPILMLSSSDGPRDIERVHKLGADFVTKPPNMDVYVAFFDGLANLDHVSKQLQ